jgi:hypothetical protein
MKELKVFSSTGKTSLIKKCLHDSEKPFNPKFGGSNSTVASELRKS